jgi:hypothetical protein
MKITLQQHVQCQIHLKIKKSRTIKKMKSSQYQINSVVLVSHLSTLVFRNPYENEKE